MTIHVLWWKERLGQYALSRVSPDLIGKGRDELLAGTAVCKPQRTPATVNSQAPTHPFFDTFMQYMDEQIVESHKEAGSSTSSS